MHDRPVPHDLQFASSKMKDTDTQPSRKYGVSEPELSIVALQVSASDRASSLSRNEAAIATTIGFPASPPAKSLEHHGQWESVYWGDHMDANSPPSLQSMTVRQSWSSFVAQTKMASFCPPSPTSSGDSSKSIVRPAFESGASVRSDRHAREPQTALPQETIKPVEPKMEPPRTQCRDQLIPPLTKIHFACYQSHRSFTVSNNARYPVPCMTCLKSDQQLRWRCTFCCLRICGDCVQAIQRCKARSLEELLESVVRALEGA